MRWFGWFRRRPKDDAGMLETLAVQEGTPLALVGGRMRTIGLPYALPRDNEDLNRLDFQHYMLRYALQGLYAAPLENPLSILDVGTGTGRWALDMAQIFPRANVVGLDVNPPPVDERASQGHDLRPPNYTYAVGNVLEGLPFADNTFDFVHMRLLFTAIPSTQWVPVMRELSRVTRPGGWVESVELGGAENSGANSDLITQWITQLSASRGVDIRDGSRVGTFMREAQLQNIRGSVVNVPCGSWGGRLGEMMATDFSSAAKGLSGLFVRGGMTTQEQFDETHQAMQADFRSPSIRGYVPWYIVIGQK